MSSEQVTAFANVELFFSWLCKYDMMQILNCRAKVFFHLIGAFRGFIEVSASFSFNCKLQLFALTSLVIKPTTSVGLKIRLCAYHIAWQNIWNCKNYHHDYFTNQFDIFFFIAVCYNGNSQVSEKSQHPGRDCWLACFWGWGWCCRYIHQVSQKRYLSGHAGLITCSSVL